MPDSALEQESIYAQIQPPAFMENRRASSLSVFKKLRQQLIPKLRLIPSVCLENTGC